MRVPTFLLLAVSLTGCAQKIEPTLSWSLPPRDNVLALALELPRADAELRPRMIAAVEAFQTVHGTNGPCDRVARLGCTYSVRVMTKVRNHVDCRRRDFTIEQRDGLVVLREERGEQIACPPPESP